MPGCLNPAFARFFILSGLPLRDLREKEKAPLFQFLELRNYDFFIE
jgi:hypothetical protein